VTTDYQGFDESRKIPQHTTAAETPHVARLLQDVLIEAAGARRAGTLPSESEEDVEQEATPPLQLLSAFISDAPRLKRLSADEHRRLRVAYAGDHAMQLYSVSQRDGVTLLCRADSSEQARAALRRVMDLPPHQNVLRLYHASLDGSGNLLSLYEMFRGTLEYELESETVHPRLFRHLAVSLLQALAYMEDNKMIHTKLRPASILIGDNWECVCADLQHVVETTRWSPAMVDGDVYDAPEILRYGTDTIVSRKWIHVSLMFLA
jgi:serine/threonine protein kinase